MYSIWGVFFMKYPVRYSVHRNSNKKSNLADLQQFYGSLAFFVVLRLDILKIGVLMHIVHDFKSKCFQKTTFFKDFA